MISLQRLCLELLVIRTKQPSVPLGVQGGNITKTHSEPKVSGKSKSVTQPRLQPELPASSFARRPGAFGVSSVKNCLFFFSLQYRREKPRGTRFSVWNHSSLRLEVGEWGIWMCVATHSAGSAIKTTTHTSGGSDCSAHGDIILCSVGRCCSVSVWITTHNTPHSKTADMKWLIGEVKWRTLKTWQ